MLFIYIYVLALSNDIQVTYVTDLKFEMFGCLFEDFAKWEFQQHHLSIYKV